MGEGLIRKILTPSNLYKYTQLVGKAKYFDSVLQSDVGIRFITKERNSVFKSRTECESEGLGRSAKTN